MGQGSSAPLGVRGGRRKSLRDSWRSPFPRRSQTHQGALSAAFHIIDDPKHIEQLNVNTASEEELMTLPGITRSIAQNIVEHRLAIGRFKKVEDLALVSGIGADKLDLIRPEICISRRKNVSCASSRAQSLDSLPSTESTQFSRLAVKSTYGRAVNVNSASVFELMAVHGLNQELAASIVEHRERRGPYHTIEDLTKVKGINQLRLGGLRSQLTVESSSDDISTKNGYTNIPNITINNASQLPNGKIPGHRKTLSAPTKYSGLTNGFLAVHDIFELLSAASQRPILEEDFHYERNNRSAMRLASWNLHQLSNEKVENPGVRETLCRTILENRFSVIAVQEVLENSALEKLCNELNCPTLRRVSDWSDNHREWKFCLPDIVNPTLKFFGGVGFLYDTGSDVELTSMKELCLSELSCNIGAVLATFKMGGVSLSLLNMYMQGSDVNCIRDMEEMVHNHVKQSDVLIILGDFSGLSRNKETDELEWPSYKGILPTATSTNSTDHLQAIFQDNIFLNVEADVQYTGVWGVVRQGLTHLAIPCGWTWGGAASEHCPVWCEIYTDTQ